MPITVTLTADSAGELKDLVVGLAIEMTTDMPDNRHECNCSNNVTVETYATAPDLSGLSNAKMNETPVTDGPYPGTPVDEPTVDTSFEPNEDESLNSDVVDSDGDDELSGRSDKPDADIATHFDEIFGTVGNRPMCGDTVNVAGLLYNGKGIVINTNYSLLYDDSYDYTTKILKVRAENGKKYSYNKSDLRAKKVTKA